MPQPNVIHIDQALTNFSQMLTNDDYVANDMAPMVPVAKRSDRWFVYGKEHFRYRNSKIGTSGVANEREYTLTTSQYYAERRAERHYIPDDNEMQEDQPLQERVDAAEVLAESLNLTREVDTANFMTSTANMTNNTALSGTSRWDDYANSVPLTNIKTSKVSVRTNSAKRANFAMIPYEVALVLADHPSIKDLIKYTDPRALTESGLPPVIRGLRVIEPGAVQDGATEGRAFAPAAIWGKNVIIGYVNPGPGLKKVSLAYTFMAPDPTSGTRGLATRRYRLDDRKGEFVETEQTYDIRMIATGAGYLWTTVIN